MLEFMAALAGTARARDATIASRSMIVNFIVDSVSTPVLKRWNIFKILFQSCVLCWRMTVARFQRTETGMSELLYSYTCPVA